MADIFGNNQITSIGGIKLQGNVLAITGAPSGGGAGYDGMLLQNFNITYQQQVTKVRALNESSVWLVVAPPNGQLQVQQAVMNADAYTSWVNDFGNACEAVNNDIQLSPFRSTCPDAASGLATAFSLPKWTLKGCMIANISLTQNIENLVLMANTTLEFVEMRDNGTAP